ncbi:unnamed protein product [Calypogeia fissa]
MWKSASSVVGGRLGSNGGERSGSFRHQTKNGRSGNIGQLEQESIRQLWETAMDGVESSAWEDFSEELLTPSRTSNASSSGSSNSPIARQGGKLLQVVKRKVNLSSGTKKASQKVQDAKDSSRSKSSHPQDGEIVPDKLLEELETLRRKLERKEKEMQKLKNEVSTLRITTAVRNVQQESQSQEDKTRRVSLDSDSSQLSCLDFSLAPSTGDLKFEGKIKAKITPASKSQSDIRDQSDSILSEGAAVGAPRLGEVLSNVNEGFASEELRSITKGSAPSQVQDTHVAANKKSLDECKAEISEPENAARVGPDGTGVKLPVKTVKEELYISTQSYVYEPEDEFFDINANASRSPPKSTSSIEEEDEFKFPIVSSDSNNSVDQQKAGSAKVADCVDAAALSPCDLSGVEVNEKSGLCKVMKGEEVQANSLTVPLSSQTNQATTNSSPAKEDPLKVLMQSCVMLEVDKLSKTMTSIRREEPLTSSKHSDLITRSTSSVSPRRRREQLLTSAKHSDPISSSTSLPSPPRSRPASAQVYPNRSVLVSRTSPDWEAKAGDSGEQPERREPSSNGTAMGPGSKMLAISTSDESMDSHGLNFGNMPLPKSRRRSNYGLQCREYATTADRHEGLPPLSPSTSPRATSLATTTTAGPYEGPSPLTSPRGRGLSTSSSSAGPKLFIEEAGWKPKSGGLDEVDLEEEVRLILEQSRQLLMSDESDNEEESNGRGSRDKPFSVLALSRHRRNMVKNSPSFQPTPEMNQQQDRPEQHQEEQAIIVYGDNDAWNITSSKVDNVPELDAEQENDHHSLNSPHEQRNGVGAPYKKDDLQLVWELELQNTKNQLFSSLPRRSRFFFEANITTPEVI